MTERGSVFAKLVAIMLATAVSLLVLVGAFFLFIVSPAINESMDRVVEEYVRTVAAASPDFDTARQVAARLDLQVRYEGPDGSWSTASDLPSIDALRSGQSRGWSREFRWGHYRLVAGPTGGTYLFAWNFAARTYNAHVGLLILLLLIMCGVVVVAHMVLRRLLRPLRVLNDGVARLSDGQLDVTLPDGARDEFGSLTRAFNHMVARVRDMIRARDQLLVDVSHELRSPLTRMKVAVELLPPDEQRTRLGGDIVEMERMIAELLELERLRSGRGLSTARQDLMVIVREVAERFRDRPPGVRVVSTSPEIPVDVDAERIRRVFQNLLENAAKYSLPQSRPVEISAAVTGDTVVIRVTDDGIGIAEGDRERVFEPFFRADPSRSKSTGGYGLGLSICKRVVEAHGGSIALERSDRLGASFILTLPKTGPPR